jgi:hypothetical protein
MAIQQTRSHFSLSFYLKQGEQGEQVASRNEKLKIKN